MTIALSTRLASRFEDAVACTREALAQNGFGVLTEIRIAETLKATLSVPLEDYLILGACNLELAYQAISVDREIGLLLPCNVVVRADPGDPDTVIVEGMDPTILVEVTGEPALVAIAREITEKLSAAIASLTAVHG
ncbi:ABC transporter [Mycobacterium mantenii]|uniref:ABC transporter n=1 Tax=Mycobacterium mantenii TaxID=560555 RepID=A0A1X0G553_MYCNT|nr:DUF302 domain-containing protein [Mycobacterium mantenii]MCV7242183.1 DUF302 domain-containing protein [Mycobacterium mantenii]ORB09147.1 ABC transporter [Mycobacterium mantenii]BBY37309.1 ABC transporter [Mycobacterium mantenii]